MFRWLRIGLPMLGTVSVPDVGRSCMMRGRARAPPLLKATHPGAHALQTGAQPFLVQLEKGCMQQRRPSAAKNEQNF